MLSRSFFLLLFLSLVTAYLGLHLLVRWIYPKQLFPYRGSTYETLPGLQKTIANDGNQIVFLFLRSEKPNAPTLFYLHGNGEDLGTNADRFAWFLDQGYSLIALDYPGYGQSSGTPTGDSVRAATLAVWDYAQDELGIQPDETVLWGRSLGGAPATFLATQDSFRGLILESTFRSVFAVANLPFPLFLREPFPTEDLLSEVESPVYLFHGDLDRTVPVSHSISLAVAAGDRARLFRFPTGEHNNLRLVGETEMKEALAELREPSEQAVLAPSL